MIDVSLSKHRVYLHRRCQSKKETGTGGEMRTAQSQILLLCAMQQAVAHLLWTSQTRSVPSSLQLRRTPSTGSNIVSEMSAVWPCSTPSAAPSASDQTRMAYFCNASQEQSRNNA